MIRNAKSQLDLDVKYLGAVEFVDAGQVPLLVAVATFTGELPSKLQSRLMRLSAISTSDQEIRHKGLFVTAAGWYEASLAATRLRQDIEQAMRLSALLLARTRTEEDGQLGWDQYLRRETVGVLSTANGILACLHSGAANARELIDKPLAALRAFQAEGGGWRIRRSLVGSVSANLITESTCHCLLALHEAGVQSAEDETVKDGISWLVGQKHADGGWSSVKVDSVSQVYPTALAVHVLALYQQAQPVQDGIRWLVGAQCTDGGWGATASTTQDPVSSSPAYTAAAIIALVSGGLRAENEIITDARDCLIRAFDPNRPEPWEPTSFNTLVDRENFARLDFRHFATPYALAALCKTGYDLSNSTVLLATRRLLDLQTNSGTFQCGLTAPGERPIWAVCGAMYALRQVLNAGGRNLGPLILDPYRAQDLTATSKAAGFRHPAGSPAKQRSMRHLIMTLWLSVLTATVVLVIAQPLIINQVEGSTLTKVGLGALTFAGALLTAVAPTLLDRALGTRGRGRS